MSGDYLLEGDPDWGWEFAAEDFVFARLDEDKREAEKLDGDAHAAALGKVESLRRIAAWHSCYVDAEGRSHARCFTCDPVHGFPCTTMRNLASLWRPHPGFRSGWLDDGDFLSGVIAAGGFRNEYLADKARKERS